MDHPHIQPASLRPVAQRAAGSGASGPAGQGFPRGETPRRRRTGLRLRPSLLLAAVLLLGLALGPGLLPPAGPRWIHVESPAPGEVVGVGGAELLVRLEARAVAPETLRVLVNGAEVTGELTTGANGAWGRIPALLDGENVIRVEVFGRSWIDPHRLVEQAQEVRVVRRRPLHWHQG